MPNDKNHSPPDDFRSLRRAREEDTLETYAKEWINMFANDQRPTKLIEEYPRIANKIASCWHDHEICKKYLAELLMDPNRLDRQGFSFAIVNEISDLNILLLRTKADPSLHKDGIFNS